MSEGAAQVKTPRTDRVIYIEVSCHGIPQPHTPFDNLAALARTLELELARRDALLRDIYSAHKFDVLDDLKQRIERELGDPHG